MRLVESKHSSSKGKRRRTSGLSGVDDLHQGGVPSRRLPLAARTNRDGRAGCRGLDHRDARDPYHHCQRDSAARLECQALNDSTSHHRRRFCDIESARKELRAGGKRVSDRALRLARTFTVHPAPADWRRIDEKSLFQHAVIAETQTGTPALLLVQSLPK